MQSKLVSEIRRQKERVFQMDERAKCQEHGGHETPYKNCFICEQSIFTPEHLQLCPPRSVTCSFCKKLTLTKHMQEKMAETQKFDWAKPREPFVRRRRPLRGWDLIATHKVRFLKSQQSWSSDNSLVVGKRFPCNGNME